MPVVEVEHRVERAQVHVRVEVGVEGADVAPVAPIPFACSGHLVLGEVVDLRDTFFGQHRDDAAAHVVDAVVVVRVGPQRLDQDVRGEDVVAHGRVRLIGTVGQAGRIRRLLKEGVDRPAVRTGADHTELPTLHSGHTQPRDGHPGPVGQVLLDHLARIHPVDVVGAEHDHDIRLIIVDEVQRLEDRIRGPRVPPGAESLLRRYRCDVVVEQIAHAPGRGDVAVQAVALVLRENTDPQVTCVGQVRQDEIDQSVEAAERDGRLGAVGGERREPLARTTGQHDAEHSWR